MPSYFNNIYDSLDPDVVKKILGVADEIEEKSSDENVDEKELLKLYQKQLQLGFMLNKVVTRPYMHF